VGRGEPRDRARRQRFVISRHRLLGADDRNRPRLVLSASAIASRSRPMTSRTRRSRIHPTWRSRSDHSTIGSRRPCRAADVRAHASSASTRASSKPLIRDAPASPNHQPPTPSARARDEASPRACGSAEAAVRGRGSRWATLEKGAAGSDCEVLAGKGHAGDRSGLGFREGLVWFKRLGVRQFHGEDGPSVGRVCRGDGAAVLVDDAVDDREAEAAAGAAA
jgi:hypothetical protein